MALPPVPEQQQLGDWCRETSSAERVQPWTVEKDFFLTRLIWGLAQVHERDLLLKGGTCLSKVDLGYHRMSEDIDVTVPGTPTRYKSTNARLINEVVRSLDAIGHEVGIELVSFDGTRSEKGAHAIWEVRYPSSFIPAASAVIAVEAAIRPVHLEPRKAPLLQLLPAALLPGYSEAHCWALEFAEVRAEKVRAAFTRVEPQIRDFFDLGLLARLGADMDSNEFRKLVDAKLAELAALPLEEQPASFGLSAERRKALHADRKLLESVVRIDEPRFDLQSVLDHYNALWGKAS